jgi:hypothetical protein
MAEHQPPAPLVAVMAAFLGAMAAASLAFWVAALVLPGGTRAVIGGMGPGVMSLFGALHVPAAIAGVLLWQWRRHGLGPRARTLLEAATIYFWAVILVGLFFGFIATRMFDRMI